MYILAALAMMIITGGAAPMWKDTDTELMLSDDVFFVGGAAATPSFDIVYCLMALVVAVSAALVFVLFRREPPRAKRSCPICSKHGHQKHCCPESPGYKVKKQRVHGPPKYIEGVHARCECIVNGKPCNKHHLRRDCEQLPVYAGADGRLSFPLTIGTIVLTPAQTAKLTTEQRRAVVLAVEISFPSQLRSQSEDEMMDHSCGRLGRESGCAGCRL
jgi:hypothetical protein